MLGEFFVIILFVSIVVSVITFIAYVGDEFDNIKTPCKIWGATIALWVWLLISASQPHSLVETHPLKVHEIDNVQIVTYDDGSLSPIEIVNLNSRFDQVVSDDTEVLLEKKVGGWYAGMFWRDKYGIILKNKKD